MRKTIIIQVLKVSAILLIFIFHCSCQPDQPDTGKYLKSVQKFANTVLDHGRDNYGELHTALFVDGLDTATLEPALWKGKGGETWVLSNFTSQQALIVCWMD